MPKLVHFSSLIPKMSKCTLAISYLTTSNLPWFTDITFQVPMQYFSLQHWTLVSSADAITTGYHFCFDSASSFLLGLFLCSSSVTYWAPTNLGSSSFSVISFLPFHTIHGVLKAKMLKWFAIPFSLDHILSGLSTTTCLGWHYVAWSNVPLI